MVLFRLPADKAGASFSLPSFVRMNTKRAGELLADVGPNFRMSYSSCSVSSDTGSEVHAVWLRASLNSNSKPAPSIVICSSCVMLHRSVEVAVQAVNRCWSEFDLLDGYDFRHVVLQHVLDPVLQRSTG